MSRQQYSTTKRDSKEGGSRRGSAELKDKKSVQGRGSKTSRQSSKTSVEKVTGSRTPSITKPSSKRPSQTSNKSATITEKKGSKASVQKIPEETTEEMAAETVPAGAAESPVSPSEPVPAPAENVEDQPE